MGIRRKIALWIDPSINELEMTKRGLDGLALSESRRADSNLKLCNEWETLARRRAIALMNISSMRTPNCANIGKRMASIAEGALK